MVPNHARYQLRYTSINILLKKYLHNITHYFGKFKNADFQYFSIFEFEEDNSVNIIHKINNNEFVEFSWFIVAPDGMRFSGLLWGGNLIFDDEFGNHSVVYSRNNNYFPEFMPLEDFIEKNPEVAEHEIMWAAD